MISIIASQAAVLLELNNNINEMKKFSDKILDNVNSGIMVIDNCNKINIFNSYSEAITGFNAEDILGKDIAALNLKLDNMEDFIRESFYNEKTYFEEPGSLIIPY